MRTIVIALAVVLVIAAVSPAIAINVVLDYTLDEYNENWFGGTPEALARRASVDAAASFLSAIITNDDWNAISIPNENLTFEDVAASTIYDLEGNLIGGVLDGDGQGYFYDIDVSNRSSVAANEYVIYIGAFQYDSGTTAHAKASWDSSDRRNSAGFAGVEFNTWGGKVYFDSGEQWYTGQNPGTDPADDYGIQDPNKIPLTDITTDNWDWSPGSQSWKGFDLRSVDNAAIGRFDLYAVALHEMIHALGATTSIIEDYVTTNAGGDFTGEHLMAEYDGPVPGDGGHFAEDTQSIVWDSLDIVSEVTLDPNSLRGNRKYLTRLDAALLRDLGYEVSDTLSEPRLDGDFNGDDTVDAADYVVWRIGLDTKYTPDDYNLWRENFGKSGSGSLSIASVPEPAGALLFLLGMSAVASHRGAGGSFRHFNCY